MSEIDELKEEVQELKTVLQDTNKQVHKMRRSQRWSTILTIVWWLSVAGISGAVYYYYLQPYITAIMDAYQNAQGFQVQVEDWFAQFGRNRTQ